MFHKEISTGLLKPVLLNSNSVCKCIEVDIFPGDLKLCCHWEEKLYETRWTLRIHIKHEPTFLLFLLLIVAICSALIYKATDKSFLPQLEL